MIMARDNNASALLLLAGLASVAYYALVAPAALRLAATSFLRAISLCKINGLGKVRLRENFVSAVYLHCSCQP